MFIKYTFDSAELQGKPSKREVHTSNTNRKRIYSSSICTRNDYATEKFYYTEVETEFAVKSSKK